MVRRRDELTQRSKRATGDHVETVGDALDAGMNRRHVLQAQSARCLGDESRFLADAVDARDLYAREGDRQNNTGQSCATAHIEKTFPANVASAPAERGGSRKAIEDMLHDHAARIADGREVIGRVPM